MRLRDFKNQLAQIYPYARALLDSARNRGELGAIVETIKLMDRIRASDVQSAIERTMANYDKKAPPAPVAPTPPEPMFDLKLTDKGGNWIRVIKAVREITNLGLKEAKDLVETTTSVHSPIILRMVPYSKAYKAQQSVVEVGGKAEIDISEPRLDVPLNGMPKASPPSPSPAA